MDPDSPRARRAARAGSSRKGPDMSQVNWGKIGGIALLVVVIGLFIVWPFLEIGPDATQADCPDFGQGPHCHSALHVWVQPDVNDPASWQRLSFAAGQYTYQGDGRGGVFPLRYHMHVGESKEQIHWEAPPKTRIEMQDFLQLADIRITEEEFLVDDGHEEVGQGYAMVANETVSIKVYEAFGTENDWEEISVSDFRSWEPVDGVKHLIVVGDPTEERLEQMQQGVPPPSAWLSGQRPANHPGA